MGIRNVLVVNAGSSSLKFMLFDMEAEKMLAKGQVERIGIDNPLFTFTTGDYSEKQTLCEAPNHTAAIKLVCNALIDPAKGGCLKSFADIDAVGHRMVHGGELYSGPVSSQTRRQNFSVLQAKTESLPLFKSSNKNSHPDNI